MSEFIVSARKYRPETFKSVIGQESITTTLRNAIKTNHLGHAYLFCGPRGVGKTTCARIFAKTINCYNLTEEAEPCNKCESCKAFNESRSYNIHELDAASNNSVDDIRNLTEQVRIPPQIGKYSVYIIDEVHMLSQSAFNAFLKTLEEPPAHAVFILATTEKHKIIPTILSRCQIFDFNRIKVEDTVKYLSYISNNEAVEFEEEALNIIAQKADGAMRDALSIFDQIISFSGKNITYQDVIENLNILDFEYYFRITESFLNGNISEALLILDEIIDKGFDGHNFITGLASHLRDLLVSSDQETIKLLEVSEAIRVRYIDQGNKCTAGFLYDALDICNQADLQYKASRNQRLLIEISLVKIANLLNEKKKPEQQLIQQKETEKHPIKKTVPPDSPGEQQEEKKTENKSLSNEPAIKDIHKKNVVKSTGISIKDALRGKNNRISSANESDSPQNTEDRPEDDSEADLENEADKEFSSEQLLEAWKAYANKLKKDKPRLYTTLSSRNPIIKPDFKIEVSFDNTSQHDDFLRNIKYQLVNFLRRELKNREIDIQTALSENYEGKKLYTPEEKYKYLINKNPLLDKLKQDFNLDFD